MTKRHPLENLILIILGIMILGLIILSGYIN
jgi:hypothetical protein